MIAEILTPVEQIIGVRRAALVDAVLEQSDGTAWMAKFCLNMLEMALRLANHQPSYEDLAVKFFEHFALVAAAMNNLWDDQDGFFYDRLRKRDGSTFTVRARSMVGCCQSLRPYSSMRRCGNDCRCSASALAGTSITSRGFPNSCTCRRPTIALG